MGFTKVCKYLVKFYYPFVKIFDPDTFLLRNIPHTLNPLKELTVKNKKKRKLSNNYSSSISRNSVKSGQNLHTYQSIEKDPFF